MGLQIDNQGIGTFGQLGDNWAIRYTTSPQTVAEGSASFGSLSFSAQCNESTVFTVDDYITVKHFFDNPAVDGLGTFDARIRSVSASEGYAQFTATSRTADLDVDRISRSNPSGTYIRKVVMPPPTAYTIGVTPYLTPAQPVVYDVIQTGEEYFAVLASGSHGGECVYLFNSDGYFYLVWPVYSDATDLANPQSRYMTYENSYLYIGQVAADRVKKFVYGPGTFVTQWGSAGTGDGQFNTISGLSVSHGFDAVYVLDSALGRVTAFQENGTYLFKWGTLGTGVGNTVFDAPNYIHVDPITDNVLVADLKARVREYGSGGGYISTPFGGYDFTNGVATGSFANGLPITITVDSRGFAHVGQAGAIQEYARDFSNFGNGVHHVKTWKPRAEYARYNADERSGFAYGLTFTGEVHQYAAKLTSLQVDLAYYIALAAEEYPLQLNLINEFPEAPSRGLAIPNWRMNVWQAVCELCAASNNRIRSDADRVEISRYWGFPYILPTDAEIEPLQITSRPNGRRVEATSQDAVYSDPAVATEFYSATSDGNRTFSVDVNGFEYTNVQANGYPEFVIDPVAAASPGVGRYTLLDRNNLSVPPADWKNYGGAVRATLTDVPGQIQLNFVGPGRDIPGYEGPYTMGLINRTGSLSVKGFGVLTNPKVINVGTGVTEIQSNRDVAETLDSPFLWNDRVAYDQAIMAAYNSGVPEQRFTVRVRIDRSFPGVNKAAVPDMVGSLTRYGDSYYIITELAMTPLGFTMEMRRYTQQAYDSGQFETPFPDEIWSGVSAQTFDSYWAEHSAQDYTIAPMRNPYGV